MILQLLIAWLAVRISRHRDHVMTYLLEENRILKAKLKGKRIQLTDTERRRLAVLAHPIDRKHLKELATIATVDTLRRWYNRLVVQASSCKPWGKRLGRPRVATEVEQLVVRMPNENPRWGYRRIQGALSNLGYHIHNTTVRNILRRNHMAPAPIRGQAGISWFQFVRLHWEVLEASDFFEARLARVAHLWTILTQLGCELSTRGSQLLGLISHGILSTASRNEGNIISLGKLYPYVCGRIRSVLALLAQQWRGGWIGYIANLDPQCHRVFGGQQHERDSQFPTRCVVSYAPDPHRCQEKPIERKQSPPGTGPPGLRIVSARSCYGRGASKSRGAAVAKVESESSHMSDQNQQMAPRVGAYPAAA